MADIKGRFVQLLQKDSLSPEEQAWVIRNLQNENGGELRTIMYRHFKKMQDPVNKQEHVIKNAEELLEAIHKKANIRSGAKIHWMGSYWKWSAAVAALLIAMWYFAYNSGRTPDEAPVGRMQKIVVENDDEDVKPGSSKATLELADGSTLVLDETINGTIAREGGAIVIKSGDKLNYRSDKDGKGKTAYNTISTPRGGQYFIELSDGTKAWLNSASSIRFPVFFQGSDRKVEVTGEVYFEVATRMEPDSGKKIPFLVKINKPGEDGGEVMVYGTKFNIMAYPDETQVQTTLLEGSVAYRNGDYIRRLEAGQQSAFSETEGIKVSEVMKMDEVISWKNGLFHFEGSDLEFVLRKLSRWYNVEVVFKRTINDKFYADIPMNTMLSDALRALELTGIVHLSIENGKIIVD